MMIDLLYNSTFCSVCLKIRVPPRISTGVSEVELTLIKPFYFSYHVESLLAHEVYPTSNIRMIMGEPQLRGSNY